MKALAAASVFALLCGAASAQEAVMEEVRVEASFSNSLDAPNDRAIDILTRRWRELAEKKRELDLQKANQNSITLLLGLTKYSPIPLGSSESRVDEFQLQNYVRAELNPPKKNSFFDSRR